MNKIVRRILATAIIFLPVLASNEALAISSEEIFTKVLVNNVDFCYKDALTSSIDLTSYNGFNSLMNDGYKQSGNTQHGIYIPAITDNYNKITATDSAGARLTSCYALFNGDATGLGTLGGNMKGLFEIYGRSAPTGHNDINALNNFMGNELMQYSINTDDASTAEYCYDVFIKETTTAAMPIKLGSACINEDNYPLTLASNIAFTGGEENSGYTLAGGVRQTGTGRDTRIGFNVTIAKDESQCYYGGRSASKCYATATLGMGVPEDGSRVNFPKPQQNIWRNAPDMYVEISKKTGNSEESRNVSYNKNNNKWKDFIVALTGKSYDDFAFSDAEKYDFYLQYLKMNYGRNETSIGSTTCQANRPSSLVDAASEKYYIYVKDSGWCLANLDSNKIDTQHVMTVFAANNNRTLTTYVKTLPELIELMGNLNYDDVSGFIEVDQSGEDDMDSTVLPTQEDTPVETTCGNSGGAMSLGWIVCPILDWMGNAADSIYTNILEPKLQVDPVLFSGNNGYTSGYTYEVWQTFQRFANIVFIIILLVVIFSQLTGVGIDNYGIKKTLPKLIVAAILVNLSYIICMICVDLSNILGNALNDLFHNLGPTGQITAVRTVKSMESAVVTVNNGGSAVGSTAITGVIILTSLVGMVGMIWTNPAVLLSLLVGALGVLIAIVFIFILLAAREAAIVVLVVISPLAFVCYILPNTKKSFDRWLKMGQGLLLLYPICGILIGAGDFVSRLLLNAGQADGKGFVPALTAMLAGIVPFFFIPTVLRSSFSAMGNLGAKISGFGRRLGKGAQGLARNSEGYKNAQKRSLERRTRLRAGYDKDGKAKNLSKFGTFMRGGRRNVARYRLAHQKNVAERGALDSTWGKDFMLATDTENERKNIVASGEINTIGYDAKRGTMTGMTKSLYDALMSGDRAKIRAYTDALTAKGEDGRVAVKAAYNRAQMGGAGPMGMRTFADNIMANHAADYKNNNRSMFEVAKEINQGKAARTTGTYLGTGGGVTLADKVTSTTMGNMDDDAFEEVFGGYNGKTVAIPAGASAVEIGAAADAALSDQNANIKAERRKYLEAVVMAAKAAGYVQGHVDVSVVNPVLNVQGHVGVDNEVDVSIVQNHKQNNPVIVQQAKSGGGGTSEAPGPSGAPTSAP